MFIYCRAYFLIRVSNFFGLQDLFVIAYWGHEFDPDGSFGAYFAHHYGIKATSFNVCDQGILSPITALQIILAYANSRRIRNAALLCFDQRSIPVENTFSGTLPAKNSARFLLFRPHQRESCSSFRVNTERRCLMGGSGADLTEQDVREELTGMYSQRVCATPTHQGAARSR